MIFGGWYLVRKIKNEEIEYLKENYNKIPIKNIAKKFGVAESIIYSRMGELGISNRFQWTEEKEEICMENNITLIGLLRKDLTKLHLVFSDFI